MLAGGDGAPGLMEWDALYVLQPAGEQRIGLVFDPSGDASAGRTAIRGIVLEAAILWGIVRGRDYDTVRKTVLATMVIDNYRVGDCGRRSVFTV